MRYLILITLLILTVQGCTSLLKELMFGCDGVELWGECYNIEETTSIILPNTLTGDIPSEIGNLTNLYELDLSYNQLTGEIPPEIGNLTNLTWLRLHNNQLTGEIPPQVCDLIESNNLPMWGILNANNLINTCE